MKLNAITVKQVKPKEKDYKLSDGKGLFLLVKAQGGKYWRQSYRFANKQKTLALGVYPEVSLLEARDLCYTAHKQIKSGVDPSTEKRSKKVDLLKSTANTFEAIAEEWYSSKLPHWAKTTRLKRRALLDKDFLPYMGSRPIKDLETIDLLTCLRRIEKRGAIDTAYTGRQMLNQVCRYAIQTQRLKYNPSTELQGALQQNVTTHRPAITNPAQFGLLMFQISGYKGSHIIKTMLSLAPLLFQRPVELASMEWEEIDLDNKLWIIPKEKKKERKQRLDDHIIPLSKQAVEFITDIQPLTGNRKYVFPGRGRNGTHASEASINKALRGLGYSTKEEHCFHGFRASARTLLDERLGFPESWIEQQLGHKVKDALGRAYNRTKHLDQRIEMMQKWSDYIDELRHQVKTGNVISASFGDKQEAKNAIRK